MIAFCAGLCKYFLKVQEGEFPLPNPPTQDQYQNRFDARMHTVHVFFFNKRGPTSLTLINAIHKNSLFALMTKSKFPQKSENTVQYPGDVQVLATSLSRKPKFGIS